MLDRLWNGWRAQYVQRDSHGKHSDESVFTEILKSKLPDEETFIVHRGETCFVIMNAYPYSSGHVLVIPYREVPDLELLTPQETSEVWATVTKAVQVLKAEYKPQGMNVGINLGHAAGKRRAAPAHSYRSALGRRFEFHGCSGDGKNSARSARCNCTAHT